MEDRRRRIVRKWSPEEDALMMRLVQEHGTKVRQRRRADLPRRLKRIISPASPNPAVYTPAPCPFQHWGLIGSKLNGRTGKQCRERWHNQLDPSIRKDPWTKEEETVLMQAHSVVRCVFSLARPEPKKRDQNPTALTCGGSRAGHTFGGVVASLRALRCRPRERAVRRLSPTI